MTEQPSDQWQKGNPRKAGWYIVAVLYDGGMGYEACDYWDTEQGWTNHHTDTSGEKIIGYIPLRKVLNQANIEFPEDLVEK